MLRENRDFWPALFCLVVVLSILLFYTAYDKNTKSISPEKLAGVLSFRDIGSSLRELNKIAALAGIGLIAAAFIIGPLSRMFPEKLAHYLAWRKFVGIAGFDLAALHSVYSLIEFYKLDIGKMLFSNPKLLGFVSAAIAILIFLTMTLTSNGEAVRRLGYRKWKALQTFGYVGLLLAVVHFVLFETRPGTGFDVRPYALVFLFIPLVALLVRAGMLLVKVPERESFEEHIGETAEPEKMQGAKK